MREPRSQETGGGGRLSSVIVVGGATHVAPPWRPARCLERGQETGRVGRGSWLAEGGTRPGREVIDAGWLPNIQYGNGPRSNGDGQGLDEHLAVLDGRDRPVPRDEVVGAQRALRNFAQVEAVVCRTAGLGRLRTDVGETVRPRNCGHGRESASCVALVAEPSPIPRSEKHLIRCRFTAGKQRVGTAELK